MVFFRQGLSIVRTALLCMCLLVVQVENFLRNVTVHMSKLTMLYRFSQNFLNEIIVMMPKPQKGGTGPPMKNAPKMPDFFRLDATV